MQLKENLQIQSKLNEHIGGGNPSIGALTNAQIVAHSSQKVLLGADDNSNMAQLNQSEAAASDQIIAGDLVVSTRIQSAVISSSLLLKHFVLISSYLFT